MGRSVISLAQRGEIGGESLDPMANPEPKGNSGGQQHARKLTVMPRLSPGLRYRTFVQAQGVSGHRPPCVKWIAAMRVAALRKPLARVMRALTWALSASARPFETA